MKIALDWDGTVTRDINFWYKFVQMCKESGHDVRIVTMRYEREIDEEMRAFEIPIICTAREQKRTFLRELGWLADIWIDDTPEFIVDRDVENFLVGFKDQAV